MSKSNVTFRDQLITVEKTDPTYRERYEKEMAAMITQELTTTKKLQTVGFLILSVCLAVLFGRDPDPEVLALKLTNEPGAFAGAAQKLADAHINITYAYCTGGAAGGKTTAIFKVADLNKAVRVLKPPRRPRKKAGRGTVKVAPRRRR